MSRTSKIVLVVLAGLLSLCVGGACGLFTILRTAVRRSVTTDPAQAAAMARAIADYDLPPGYKEQGGLKILNASFVILAAGERDAVIMLMQFPAQMEMDQSAMSQQMDQAMQQQLQRRNLQLRVVGHRQVTIRGQKVTLTTSEGSDADGRRLREVTGLFQGKAGPVMLLIMGQPAYWDQAAIDRFLASIR